jgi:thiamine-monophosphate kinase
MGDALVDAAVPSPDWLEGFARGFGELARAHEVMLVGGDTTAGPLAVSVQIMGHVPRGTALRRGGGREGDVLAVTGTIGDAGAGLALATGALATDDAAAASELRRASSIRRRESSSAAARGLASAAMDLSDGLAGDLPKLAAASGLAAHVDVERLPLSRALRRGRSATRARFRARRRRRLRAARGRAACALRGARRPSSGIELNADRDR